MTDLSDHFRTAQTMAHMLRTLPDDYEQRVYKLVARTPQAKAYLDAGVALVVIEALIEHKRLIEENIAPVLTLQKVYGASGAVALINELPESGQLQEQTLAVLALAQAKAKGMLTLPTVAAPRVPRVTIAERREKRKARKHGR